MSETTLNYLQNKCNNFRHLLKSSPYYRVKHKSFKMLQLLYQLLMTKLCLTFMITLWIVNRFETHSTNLEHCFTASTTAHSISILSELKISSFGMYGGTKTRYQLHSVEGRAKCPTVPRELVSRDWYTRCWTRQ